MKAEILLKTSTRRHCPKLAIPSAQYESNGTNNDVENQPISNSITTGHRESRKRKAADQQGFIDKAVRTDNVASSVDEGDSPTVDKDDPASTTSGLPQHSEGQQSHTDWTDIQDRNMLIDSQTKDGKIDRHTRTNGNIVTQSGGFSPPQSTFIAPISFHGNSHHAMLPSHGSAFKTVRSASQLHVPLYAPHLPANQDILPLGAGSALLGGVVNTSPSPSTGSVVLVDAGLSLITHSPTRLMTGQVDVPEESLQVPSPSTQLSPVKNYPSGIYPGDRDDTPTHPYKHLCRWMSCDRRFTFMDDLVNHVNDQHVKVERPDVDYQCKWEDCPRKGKGFNARYKMLIHIRTHTNEKPHQCNLCGKCFSRLENLKIHNRSHTGEKPYICPFEGCNKAYSNSSDRFKHVRTHQEEKPYICKMPGCNKRYTDPSSLRKHVRTHGHYFRSDSDPTSSSTKPSASLVPPGGERLHHDLTRQHASLSSISSPSSNHRLYGMPANPIIPLSIGLPMNLMQQGVTSNPLLSSALLTSGCSLQTMSPHTDSVISISPSSPLKLDLPADKLPADHDEKSQDGPLDLTTSSPSDRMDEDDQQHMNYSSKWVI